MRRSKPRTSQRTSCRVRDLLRRDARRWAREDVQLAEEWFALEEEAAQLYPSEGSTEAATSSAISSAIAPAKSEKRGKRTKRAAKRVRG